VQKELTVEKIGVEKRMPGPDKGGGTENTGLTGGRKWDQLASKKTKGGKRRRSDLWEKGKSKKKKKRVI